jgi:hypothetical protein
MPKLMPIQNSFAAGELSPLMSARTDLEGYKYGVEIMENWISLTQGPAARRPGLGYIGDVVGTNGRIFPFYVSSFTGFIVSITDEFVTVNDPTGEVVKNNLVTNGDFTEGEAGWTDISVPPGDAIFSGGAAILNPGVIGAWLAGIQQGVSGLDIANSHKFTITRASGPDSLTVNLGTTLGGTEIHSGTYSTLSNIVVEIPVGYTGIFIDIIAPGGTDPNRVISKVELIDNEVIEGVQFDSPWTTATQLATLQVEMPPGEVAMYIVNPEVAPYKLEYSLTTGDWTLDLLTLTDPPAEWVGTNWPGTLTFFESRLWLGGTVNSPETIWASVVNNYGNFTLGTTATDAMELVLNVKGSIRWIAGLRNLLVGTENGEHIVFSNEGTIIPGDIHSDQQSANGSLSIQPVKVGNKILYISADGTRLRSMDYTWTKEAWTSLDITYASEHIAEPGIIRDISYAKTPNNVVLMTTSLGSYVGCTYTGESEDYGWHRQNTPGGRALSTCVLDTGGVAKVWVLTNRERTDGKLNLERSDNLVPMDNHGIFFSETPTKIITGMQHLTLQTVSVVADGLLYNDKVVDELGNIYLENEINSAYAGVSYVSTLQFKPKNNPGQRGSSEVEYKHWNKIAVRLVNSALPKVNGYRAAERHPSTPMDTQEPAITGDVYMDNRGWSREGLITIEQDLPFVTIVAGVFGELSQETL